MPLIVLAASAVGVGVSWLGLGGSVRLAERVDAQSSSDASGQFPVFDDERTFSREVTLSGNSRLSITPPFPSRLSFTIDVPGSGVLELATALVMMQQVSRARVRFTASVLDDGASTVVFEEILTLAEANRFREARADLGHWAGRTVVLLLEVTPFPPNRDVLWADRVQTVWGDPVVRPAGSAAVATEALENWLEEYETLGTAFAERVNLRDFGINLFLAGLAAWFIAWCCKTFSAASGTGFANGFMLFTLIATLLIAVVHSSVALSLGFLGALSVVRFRSAVENSEHLLYLLLCISVALALGTNQRLLALTTVIPIFLAVFVRLREGTPSRRFHVEARGRANDSSAMSFLESFDELADSVIIERLSLEGDEVDVHARLELTGAGGGASLAAELRRRLRSLRLSLSAVDERG